GCHSVKVDIIGAPVLGGAVIFFFSSRRRHTRSKRDWSSDVCSSDLRWFQVKTLIEIKKGLEDRIGKRIELTANGGRRKTVVRSGVLSETYPAVFVVDLDQEENALERVSYSYADGLTETLEINILDDKYKIVAEDLSLLLFIQKLFRYLTRC